MTYFRDGEAGRALRITAEIPFTAWRGIAGLIRVGSRKLSYWCIVRAISTESLGTLREPLQTTVDFDARIRLDQPINDR